MKEKEGLDEREKEAARNCPNQTIVVLLIYENNIKRIS